MNTYLSAQQNLHLQEEAKKNIHTERNTAFLSRDDDNVWRQTVSWKQISNAAI